MRKLSQKRMRQEILNRIFRLYEAIVQGESRRLTEHFDGMKVSVYRMYPWMIRVEVVDTFRQTIGQESKSRTEGHGKKANPDEP